MAGTGEPPLSLDQLLCSALFAVRRPRSSGCRNLRSAVLALFLTSVACATPGTDGQLDKPGSAGGVACAQLVGAVVPASAIALPTSGAVVSSADMVDASGAGPNATPEHCLVKGAVHPIDANAPDIEFEIALPTSWNLKMMMFGGGGYDGAIPSLIGNVPAGPVDGLTPIQRGYAVFGSDSGHRAGALKSADGSFGLNDEAVSNFA